MIRVIVKSINPKPSRINFFSEFHIAFKSIILIRISIYYRYTHVIRRLIEISTFIKINFSC